MTRLVLWVTFAVALAAWLALGAWIVRQIWKVHREATREADDGSSEA